MRGKWLYVFVHTLVLCSFGGNFCGAAQFCPLGDLTNDCEVDSRDVAVFGLQWLDPQGMCTGSQCANLDGVGGVEATDFVLLAKDWCKKGQGLVINEFMASNTSTWSDPIYSDFPDWIEIYNFTDATIDMGGMYLTDELNDPAQHQIPSGVTIASGQHLLFIADDKPTRGPTHTNFSLKDTGEEVGLTDVDGVTLIDGFDFGDLPQSADISFGRYPDGSDNWRYMGTPTPEAENEGVYIPPLGAIVFNEILAHSHLGDPDWIELHNTTDTAIDIGGWLLSDSNVDYGKYEIPEGPAAVIGAHGYVVFYEDQHFGDGNMPGCHTPFALSENGETVYLHSAFDGQMTGYVERQEFRASETNVAFGKYFKQSTQTYNFVAMSANTPNGPNAYPKVGPIVINEIMYNPPTDNDDEEYVELLNISGGPIVLYDTITDEPWKFTDNPDDPGIVFFFPRDVPVVMADGEYILLVNSLAAFNTLYGSTVPYGTKVFEWSSGQLKNSKEQPQLWKPGDVDDLGVRQYIRVDRVSYYDGGQDDDFPEIGYDPWPTGPDGSGQSLTRKVPSDYGNDPVNWKGATPSPGTANP